MALLHGVVGGLPTFIIKGNPQNDQERSERVQAMGMIHEMLQLLLIYVADDPLVVGKQMDGLTCFAEVFDSEPSELPLRLLQKVF
jgi:hypothetical protein